MSRHSDMGKNSLRLLIGRQAGHQTCVMAVITEHRLVKDALSPDEVQILKRALQEQAAGERKAGVATFDGGPDTPNQRIW